VNPGQRQFGGESIAINSNVQNGGSNFQPGGRKNVGKSLKNSFNARNRKNNGVWFNGKKKKNPKSRGGTGRQEKREKDPLKYQSKRRW